MTGVYFTGSRFNAQWIRKLELTKRRLEEAKRCAYDALGAGPCTASVDAAIAVVEKEIVAARVRLES